MALPLGSIIGLGAAGLGSLFGLGQKLQANSLERRNKMPQYTVNENIATNAAQAQNMAQIGIAQQQYNNALNQQNQNLSTVLNSASRSGRNIGVGNILRQANYATQNLNAQDAAARQNNQRYAAQQRNVLAQEERAAWNWNFAQPYLRTAQRVAALRNAGNQNLFGGIGVAAQMGLGGAFDGNGSSSGSGTSYIGSTPNFFNQMQMFGQSNNGFNGINS